MMRKAAAFAFLLSLAPLMLFAAQLRGAWHATGRPKMHCGPLTVPDGAAINPTDIVSKTSWSMACTIS